MCKPAFILKIILIEYSIMSKIIAHALLKIDWSSNKPSFKLTPTELSKRKDKALTVNGER